MYPHYINAPQIVELGHKYRSYDLEAGIIKADAKEAVKEFIDQLNAPSKRWSSRISFLIFVFLVLCLIAFMILGLFDVGSYLFLSLTFFVIFVTCMVVYWIKANKHKKTIHRIIHKNRIKLLPHYFIVNQTIHDTYSGSNPPDYKYFYQFQDVIRLIPTENIIDRRTKPKEKNNKTIHLDIEGDMRPLEATNELEIYDTGIMAFNCTIAEESHMAIVEDLQHVNVQ